ncbi:sensor histidine kinase [Clostridium estertheticum]|uniref:sensor histidine kinase n=1 Tax=Clostridium estertheticum TaxID=238834 RepID=UPI001C6F18EC|nr:sensor histidine kinase [Clostridium estertheticum]MBW9150992.1 ATP-binding protein [Clostridium estertheticum]WLC84297.1 ATP-binding protein [Clostridium estertheticum]
MENTLRFRTNSKLEKLVGRELITNNTIAFFELIKNSYDAGSSKVEITFQDFTNYNLTYKTKKKVFEINGAAVPYDTVISRDNSKIIIEDSGCGMSLEEIKRFWMEMGTVHKEKVKTIDIRHSVIDKMHTRILNGEKGIGRFGTDKLGSKLKLISIDKTGIEKTIVFFDWSDFDDHSTMIQDINIKYSVELLTDREQSGVRLEISNLRDEWTIKNIENLKMQLKKFISPFSQESSYFNIYVETAVKERIVNDSFEYTNTSIEAEINNNGELTYTIQDNLDIVNKTIMLNKPVFGQVKLKVLYMDRVSKLAFTKRTGLISKSYGNIKVFRDNFRIFPYGEPENDWLGIDNKHAQAVFRSLGTRDIIGYVQISNIENSGLRDATSRLGLVEDTAEFEEFKIFIWKCIGIFQDFIFNRIKEETEKQGRIIENKVKEGQENTNEFKKVILEAIGSSNIPKIEAKNIIDIINKNTKIIHSNFATVKKANYELAKKVKIYERIMGSEGILYDILHVIKNKTALIQAQLFSLDRQCKRANITLDSNLIKNSLETINKLVFNALRKASSARLKRKVEILQDIMTDSIQENAIFATERNVKIKHEFKDNFQRIYCNNDSIKIVFDNLFNNSFKALEKSEVKEITIETKIDNNFIEVIFSDSGLGINGNDAPFIFNVGFSNTKGSGLGLSASLDIVQDHGGDISCIQIDGVSSGASFLLKFPIYKG